MREQDVVYRIGQELAAILLRDGRFDVRLSRPTADTQVGESLSDSLRTRVSDANSWGADYFLSLHTNASDITAASGVEAYAYSRASQAFFLGENIVESISDVTGLPNRGMKVRTNLYVLRRTAMPAVLIELGF